MFRSVCVYDVHGMAAGDVCKRKRRARVRERGGRGGRGREREKREERWKMRG